MTGKSIQRITYRLRQGWSCLRATMHPDRIDLGPARQVLDAPAFRLFMRLSPADRAHGLCVLSALRKHGPWPIEVEQAALLHDIGKIDGGLSLAHRSFVVLMSAVGAQGLLKRMAGDGQQWRHPFWVQRHHAELGAELCRQAGCAPLTIELVRQHESPLEQVSDPELLRVLEALQAADSSC